MMKKTVLFLAILLVAVPLGSWGAAAKTSFTAYLAGDQEVPPVKTTATGNATFELGKDGKNLKYQLMVTDLKNLTMAHIHQGAKGKNGPVVVWLYPKQAKPALKKGEFTGVLAAGTITAANLAGPLKGKPLSALVQEMKSGGVYVNVHTKKHPEGEIRGQIQ
jgi:hypothetical protein